MSEHPSRLEKEVRAEIDRRVEFVDAAAQLERLGQHLARPRRHPRTWLWVAAAGLAAVAVLVLLFRPALPPTEDLRCVSTEGELAQGSYVVAESSQTLAFSDGSQMALAAGSRARLMQSPRGEVRLALEEGGVHSVIRKGTGRWTVEAGPWKVRVVGTRFDVRWLAPDVTVEVEEGIVEVTGPGLSRQLTAGQRFDSPRLVTTNVGPTEAPRPAVVPSPAPQLPEPRARPARPATDVVSRPQAAVPQRDWKTLAQHERYREAMVEVEQLGPENVLSGLAPWDGLLLSDAARFAGQPELAVRALSAVRQRSPGTTPAALAAFRLGRARFQEGAFEEAVGWFDRFLAEAPLNELAVDARGKRMEALALSGRLDEARRAARDYLVRHPGGPHAGRADDLIAAP